MKSMIDENLLENKNSAYLGLLLQNIGMLTGATLMYIITFSNTLNIKWWNEFNLNKPFSYGLLFYRVYSQLNKILLLVFVSDININVGIFSSFRQDGAVFNVFNNKLWMSMIFFRFQHIIQSIIIKIIIHVYTSIETEIRIFFIFYFLYYTGRLIRNTNK